MNKHAPYGTYIYHLHKLLTHLCHMLRCLKT